MGRLYIPAVNQVSGPWMLSYENLETLDKLFDVVDAQLRKALEKTSEQKIEEETQKLAIVTFADGNTYQTQDIKGIIDHVNTYSSSPTELNIRTIHGSHENEFNLIINSNTSKEEVEFEYRIRCLDEDIQQEIKTSIDKWIRENKVSHPLQIWSNVMVYFIWFIGFFIILNSWSNLSYTSSKTEGYKSALKNEAKKIIEQKSSSTNVDSTLLLLLKLQSDYVPDEINAKAVVVYDKGAKKTLIASLIIFIISLIRPKTIIGIGKKYNKFKFYKFWWRYIIVGGTSLLIATFLTDGITHFIHW